QHSHPGHRAVGRPRFGGGRKLLPFLLPPRPGDLGAADQPVPQVGASAATEGSGGAAPEAAPHPPPGPPRAAPHPPVQQPLLHHRGMAELAAGMAAFLPGAGVVHHRLHPGPASPRRPGGLGRGGGDEHHPAAAGSSRSSPCAPPVTDWGAPLGRMSERAWMGRAPPPATPLCPPPPPRPCSPPRTSP